MIAMACAGIEDGYASLKAPMHMSSLLCSVKNTSTSVKQLKTMRSLEDKNSYIIYKVNQCTYYIEVSVSHPDLQYHHLG
jgi:hypothetical protein